MADAKLLRLVTSSESSVVSTRVLQLQRSATTRRRRSEEEGRGGGEGEGKSRHSTKSVPRRSEHGGGSGSGSEGHADGEGSAAKFDGPQGVCACAAGSVWVADTPYNQCIRRIVADGTVSTVAGVVGSRGYADGEGSAAKFDSPQGVCACADGSVWVADTRNQCIRRIAADGTVSTVAGVAGLEGHADGEGSVAKFKYPVGVCACADGSVTRASAKQENRLYAAPWQLLRSVCPSMMYNNPR
jgi:hypothetical protein